MNWFQKLSQFEEGIPSILSGLASEANKYSNPEEFEKAFLLDIKHGMYWHLTNNSDFFINPELGPTDMSSMGNSRVDTGKLMVTTDLEYWALEYAPDRPYAALIDMSLVPKEEYKQVNRGFGNEFFVSDPSKAKVVAVFDIKNALKIDYEHRNSLPQSSDELYQFWQKSRGVEIPYLSPQDLRSFTKHLPEEVWNRQWQKDWAHEWQSEELDKDNYQFSAKDEMR